MSHDPSEIILIIWLLLKKHFFLSMLKKTIFGKTLFIPVLFKEHNLFKMEIFCNLINVFTVTFDEFMAEFIMHPYWIRIWISFEKILLTSNKANQKVLLFITNEVSAKTASYIFPTKVANKILKPVKILLINIIKRIVLALFGRTQRICKMANVPCF